jgi:hypothetical protein
MINDYPFLNTKNVSSNEYCCYFEKSNVFSQKTKCLFLKTQSLKMADVDDETGSQEGNQQYEEEDVWEDPVEDVDTMEDGPRTIIVGGSSRVESIDDALERYRGPGDRIIVMPGTYETGMILDSGKFPRLHIYGAFPAPTEAEEREARRKQKDLEERAEEIAEEEAMNR